MRPVKKTPGIKARREKKKTEGGNRGLKLNRAQVLSCRLSATRKGPAALKGIFFLYRRASCKADQTCSAHCERTQHACGISRKQDFAHGKGQDQGGRGRRLVVN